MPDLASRNEARTSWVLLPIEDTIPIPVTTTRLIARPFLASSCRSSLCQTRTRRMTHPSQGCWLLAGCKEPDAKIGGSVDHLAVGLHHSVGNGKLQAAQDHPLQVDDVLHGLGCGHDHAGKLNLAHAQRPTLARGAEPAQKKAGKLPERIEPQAARHHWVALEMAGEKPIERGVARHLELGHHLTLAVRAAHLRDPGNSIKHQHGGQRQLGIARAEQLATAAGEQICVFVGCNALWHRPPSTKCRCANATCALFTHARHVLSHSSPAQKPVYPCPKSHDQDHHVDVAPHGMATYTCKERQNSKLRDWFAAIRERAWRRSPPAEPLLWPILFLNSCAGPGCGRRVSASRWQRCSSATAIGT